MIPRVCPSFSLWTKVCMHPSRWIRSFSTRRSHLAVHKVRRGDSLGPKGSPPMPTPLIRPYSFILFPRVGGIWGAPLDSDDKTPNRHFHNQTQTKIIRTKKSTSKRRAAPSGKPFGCQNAYNIYPPENEHGNGTSHTSSNGCCSLSR